MPVWNLVYEYANELKQAALPHTTLDYQRRAITHWHTGLHDIDHVCHSPPAAIIGAYTTHSVILACRRTHTAHNTLTPEQPKPTGTASRVILRTKASDRFRRHSEWFSWWTFNKKKIRYSLWEIFIGEIKLYSLYRLLSVKNWIK